MLRPDTSTHISSGATSQGSSRTGRRLGGGASSSLLESYAADLFQASIGACEEAKRPSKAMDIQKIVVLSQLLGLLP